MDTVEFKSDIVVECEANHEKNKDGSVDYEVYIPPQTLDVKYNILITTINIPESKQFVNIIMEFV